MRLNLLPVISHAVSSFVSGESSEKIHSDVSFLWGRILVYARLCLRVVIQRAGPLVSSHKSQFHISWPCKTPTQNISPPAHKQVLLGARTLAIEDQEARSSADSTIGNAGFGDESGTRCAKHFVVEAEEPSTGGPQEGHARWVVVSNGPLCYTQ